ncbi:MAG: aldo/keto reductase [Leptospiraceae bacterium]|nr:aldo/keto reductase [Leptospiraceae bacterium]
MILTENFELANGVLIPKIGLGTWFIADKDAATAVYKAAEIGYRHFDSAQAYGNERGVGEGVRSCGVDRSQIFVTTKLAAEIKSHPEAAASIDNSLSTLGLDYIDLMLIHSPRPWMQFHETEAWFEGNLAAWRAMEDALQAGKLRAIGVSNFERPDLDNILTHSSVPPMVNQVLAHISNTPFALIEYCKQHQILVQAYSPLAHGELFKNATLQAMAQKYNVSLPQLSIRYCLELGLLPLPKTARPEHMRNNAAVDFTISAADLAVLKNMEQIKDYGEASMFPVYGGKL